MPREIIELQTVKASCGLIDDSLRTGTMPKSAGTSSAPRAQTIKTTQSDAVTSVGVYGDEAA
jgi:hypothetical protein